jgi:hypothetical protein
MVSLAEPGRHAVAKEMGNRRELSRVLFIQTYQNIAFYANKIVTKIKRKA